MQDLRFLLFVVTSFVMRRLVPSVWLLLALVAQAASGPAASFLCRMTGIRYTQCCCPKAEAQQADLPAVSESSCCDVVQGSDADQATAVNDSPRASGPERSPNGWLVAPCGFTAILLPERLLLDAPRGAGPPGRSPPYLSNKHLLI